MSIRSHANSMPLLLSKKAAHHLFTAPSKVKKTGALPAKIAPPLQPKASRARGPRAAAVLKGKPAKCNQLSLIHLEVERRVRRTAAAAAQGAKHVVTKPQSQRVAKNSKREEADLMDLLLCGVKSVSKLIAATSCRYDSSVEICFNRILQTRSAIGKPLR